MRKNEILYFVFFALLFGFRAIGGHDGWGCYPYTLAAAAAFLLLKLLATRHTVREYLWILLFLLLGGIVYACTGEKGLLIDFAMMLGMKDMCDRRLFRFAGVLLGGAMAVLTFLTVFGLMDEIRFGVVGRPLWGQMYRHSLGYPHTNTLMTTYVILMMLTLYLIGGENRKRLLRGSLILWICGLYYYLYCNSNTGLLISTLYLAINYYCQVRLRYRLWEKAVIYAVYPLVNAVAVAGMLLYREEWQDHNALTSFLERFRTASIYLHEYSITLFGMRMEIPESLRYGLDISQIYLLLNLGLTAFAAVSVLYGIVLHEMIRERNGGAIAIILCLVVMGVSDPLLYNLSCKNLTFLFMGMALYRLLARKKTTRFPWLGREICLLPAKSRYRSGYRCGLKRRKGVSGR